mmetsp:Transcript_18400/g.36770  ORF Transcript_18400/g.36770 Transcript_18400/m.36770 type:complete len:257 (+) Transcript_18400:55-825(+)
MGLPMIPSSPSLASSFPSNMFLTPNMMGYFRSSLYPFDFPLMRSTRAKAVSTPSATSLVSAKISAIVSPFPSLTPNALFRERGPKHVPKVSPTPLRPARVEGSAPMYSPSLLISAHPLVTKLACAFIPRFSPSHIPLLMAMTFLTLPPTSTPVTSEDVKTRKVGEERRSARSEASCLSVEATTTAVARHSIISRAKLGPDRNAYSLSVPSSSSNISFMNPRLVVSMPLLALRTGVWGGTCEAICRRKALEYCTGTA